MKERFFKVTESMAEVIRTMDDKTSGRFFKAVCDYAFCSKGYTGNSAVIKSNFILVRKMLDEQSFYTHCEKMGAEKRAEEEEQRKRDRPKIRKIILGGDLSEVLSELFSDKKDEKKRRRKYLKKDGNCKQVKSFSKIGDFIKTEARRTARRTIGKPDFLLETLWAEN